MTEFAITCESTTGNTGMSGCGVDTGRWTGLVLCPKGTEIASKATAILEATWTAKFKALRNARSFPIAKTDDFIPGENTENYQAGANGDSAHLNTMLGTHAFEIFLTPDKYSINEWHDIEKICNFGSKDAYVIAEKGYLIGWQPDSTTIFKAFDLKLLRAEILTARSKDSVSKGVIKFSFEKSEELKRMVVVKPTAFDPNDFEGLINVEVAATTGAATVTVAVIDVTEANTGVGVSGYVYTDFTGTKVSDASVVAVTEVAESSTVAGRYTLTYSTQAAGDYTFGLKVPSLMTTAGYEMTTAQATVTIPS